MFHPGRPLENFVALGALEDTFLVVVVCASDKTEGRTGSAQKQTKKWAASEIGKNRMVGFGMLR